MPTEGNGAQGLARLDQLRRQIERWRRTRMKRSPMPAELWTAATDLARELGVSRVARELGVGYESLKERAGPHGEPGARPADAFVELAVLGDVAPVRQDEPGKGESHVVVTR